MNLSSQVKALHLVQLQYEDTIEEILPFFYDTLTKNQQIRIRQWIKKLSSVINNILWRKNRNLYAKLLLAMLKTKSSLTEPFHKCPPDGSLPKLSIYQIPYNLKSFIENYEKEYRIKQEKRCKSKQKFTKTEFNKENIMSTMNKQKPTNKSLQKSQPIPQLSRTLQKQHLTTHIPNKKFSLTSQKLDFPTMDPTIKEKHHQKTLSIHDANDLLNETLDFLNDNFELLMQNHKDHKSKEAKEISRLRSLILRINEFQERVYEQEETPQSHQDSALEETGYQIIQRLFK